jgi:hypothetical protein
MALFGKKEDKKFSDTPPPIMASVTVIPDAFYGGADPVIHYASEAARNNPSGTMTLLKKAPPPPPRPAAPKKSKKGKILLLVGALLLLIFGGLTAWYYFQKPRAPEPPPPPPTRPVLPPPPPPVVATTTPPVVEPPPEVATGTARFSDRIGQFPRILLVDSPDLDADTLTDAEEGVLTTDSGEWDTDGDGYFDGQEVMNLYNPRGFAPIRLVDSGLIREYVNPNWQYRIYYPLGWEAASVDAEGNQVIFSALSGDFVEVRAFQKNAGETFEQWFGRTVSGQQITDLVPLSNRFQEDGWRRKDNLVAYYETPETVFVIIYHPAVEDAIQFRQIMVMMRESFRPERTTVDIPEQPTLPQG